MYFLLKVLVKSLCIIGFFIISFIMVGIAKFYGILMGELMKYFKIFVVIGALVMGVLGVVYIIIGSCYK